jgi:hypothetical protein
MGSRQNAVKAFLDVVSCDDSTMLDRWIPDEDWVRQIRENGERDCSIANLNRGMSAQCCWQNNHVTLQGETIFYNKKNIQTTKTKAIASKPIRFYYVLSARTTAAVRMRLITMVATRNNNQLTCLMTMDQQDGSKGTTGGRKSCSTSSKSSN